MRLPTHCLLAALAIAPAAAQNSAFGTAVVDSSGLEGRVYLLSREGSQAPPTSRTSMPVGTVYTNTLNVWPQHFSEGFPSVSDRFESLAVEHTGKFWVENPGEYCFSLLSDDGAKLPVDDKVVIDNDGIHGAEAISAAATLFPRHASHRSRLLPGAAVSPSPWFSPSRPPAAPGPSSIPTISNRPAIPPARKGHHLANQTADHRRRPELILGGQLLHVIDH